jgi:hypothetical protein
VAAFGAVPELFDDLACLGGAGVANPHPPGEVVACHNERELPSASTERAACLYNRTALTIPAMAGEGGVRVPLHLSVLAVIRAVLRSGKGDQTSDYRRHSDLLVHGRQVTLSTFPPLVAVGPWSWPGT